MWAVSGPYAGGGVVDRARADRPCRHVSPGGHSRGVGDDAWDLVDAERVALADFLIVLSPDEWSTPSLCGKWSVQEVAAHLAFANTMLLRALFIEIARDRSGPTAPMPGLAQEWARRGPGGDCCATAGPGRRPPRTPVTRPQDVLADFMCHNLDIRRPLGRERLAPPEPTRRALTAYVGMGFPQALAFGRNPKATARGLHLVAEDVGWEHGAGPLVTAPSSALDRGADRPPSCGR